jgi:ribonucleoside-diphosphate reductase alpha chain
MLAIEKGPFPVCDRKRHIESGFIKRMPKKIRSLILEHGIRNCAILTQAPTGTVSIVSGNCSSGVEPMFAPAYERRFFVGNQRQVETVFHPLFDQFMKEGKSVEHFVGSTELSVEQHLEVQRIVQKHIDNAVSKTINMAKDYSMEDMSKVWLKYLPDLKGTTFYRDGSRNYIDENGVEHEPPLKAISLEEAKKRFAIDNKVDTMVVDDCAKGICEVSFSKKD